MRIILFLSMLFSFSANASVCKFGTKVFFGNGMFNTWKNAYDSKKELERLDVSEIGVQGEVPEFDLAYNRNESEILNAVSAVVQKFNNNYKTAWRTIFGLDVPPPETALDFYSLILEPISGNQDEMIRRYRSELKSGNKVIIVSHSQGNFFAEEALSALSSFNPMTMGLGNVRVATPAFSSYSFPYTTFEDDFWMSLIRKTVGAPKANLPAIGAGAHPRDPQGRM